MYSSSVAVALSPINWAASSVKINSSSSRVSSKIILVSKSSPPTLKESSSVIPSSSATSNSDLTTLSNEVFNTLVVSSKDTIVPVCPDEARVSLDAKVPVISLRTKFALKFGCGGSVYAKPALVISTSPTAPMLLVVAKSFVLVPEVDVTVTTGSLLYPEPPFVRNIFDIPPVESVPSSIANWSPPTVP